MVMRMEPMASGAITPAPPITTEQPIVRTRKKVPINSAIYLSMGGFGLLGLLWIEEGYRGKRDEARAFAFQNLAGYVTSLAHEATGASSGAEISDDGSGNFLSA